MLGLPCMGEAADHALLRYLDRHRDAVRAEIVRLFDRRAENTNQLYDLIMDYPLREGKGLRPAIAIAACRSVGGELDAVLPTAATLELFHNAFLIHDDVEDDSLVRRGKPTLHMQHGVPVAINVGDAMLCLTLWPLLENIEVVGLGEAIRVLKEIASMTQITVEGQAIELQWITDKKWDLDDEDYVSMVEKKTGWYSFIAPVRVGLMCGRASEATLTHLSEYARLLSVAFQITDDVLNLDGDLDLYGKEIGGDLWEGKRTLILLHALRTASEGERKQAIAALDRCRPSAIVAAPLVAVVERIGAERGLAAADIEALCEGIGSALGEDKTFDDVRGLLELIHRTGSLDYARGEAHLYAAQARASLKAAELPESEDRRFLESIIDYVVERNL